ncbi:hypothetical protein OAW20_04285 [Gammaproteobacteria bacterium]|nr:hypothetical protein [Gammaproteobacteria bacterium]
MKKILFILIASLGFASFSFSESVTRLGVNYVDLEVDETDYTYAASIDGYGISLDSAVTENVLLTLDYFRLTEDGESADFNFISAAYAVGGDLSEGAFTIGFSRSDSDLADTSDTDVEVGYSKRSGENVDYTFSVIASEETTIRAKIMTPVGISFGLLTDGDIDLWNLGYEYKF